MGLHNKLSIPYRYKAYVSEAGPFYRNGDGIFGISAGASSTHQRWIRKCDSAGNILWTTQIAYDGSIAEEGGVILLVGDRIYFRDLRSGDDAIVWIPYDTVTGTIEEFPSKTEIIAYGGGSHQLHGESDTWWQAALYQDSYLLHCDAGAHRIVVTDLDGNWVGEFGSYGSGDNNFNRPYQICVIRNNIVAIADQANSRVCFWRLASLNPFIAEIARSPFSDSAWSGYGIKGVGCWKGTQLYVVRSSSARSDIYEYLIDDDLNITSESSAYLEAYASGIVSVAESDNKLVIGSHTTTAFVYNITTIQNLVDEDVPFELYAVISGVGVDINFDLVSGSPQVLGDLSLTITAEAYTQENTFDESFFFDIETLAGHYDMISEFGFELTAGEYGVRETFGFDLFAGQNHGENVFGFELYTETGQTEFSTLEQEFAFEILASMPHSGGAELELETLELRAAGAQDQVATTDIVLETFTVEAFAGAVGELTLSSLLISGAASAPQVASSALVLPQLEVHGSLPVPAAATMLLRLEDILVSGSATAQGAVEGALLLPALNTHGYAQAGASIATFSGILTNLKADGWATIVPSVTGDIVLPAMEISGSETIEIYTPSELYDGNSIIYHSTADYPEVDLTSLPELEVDQFDIQGIAVNLATRAITKIGYPSTYNVIDIGYLDVHQIAVSDYLVMFIYGDMPTEEDNVGYAVVGDYSYEIKRWITDGEWRVVVGRGLTKRFIHDPDNRYQRILLQLKNGFELKGITILATPNPRRLR